MESRITATNICVGINLTEKEILQIIEECDTHLKTEIKIKFCFDRKWSDNFPSKAGIYAIFYDEQLFYIGETANLKERMKEVKRTLNHTIRKKLCKHLSLNSAMEKGKFTVDTENELDLHFAKYISFTYKDVNFGRLEIENHLMQKNENLLNSISIRGKIYTNG